MTTTRSHLLPYQTLDKYADTGQWIGPSLDEEDARKDKEVAQRHVAGALACKGEMQRIDFLSPFYFGQIESLLTGQQRAIVQLFGEGFPPFHIHPKDIIRKLDIKRNVVTNLLAQLLHKKFIKRTGKEGRSPVYEIADPELLKYLVFNHNHHFRELVRQEVISCMHPYAISSFIDGSCLHRGENI